MSAIDRFNKYKSLADAAASACIRMFLHIVRPTEGFPYHSNFAIQQTWAEWKDADEVFGRMTGLGAGANHVFPTPPPEDAEHAPCRQMWGLLVQQQVEGQGFQAPLIKNAVAAILASEACKSHPATCACKVPKNPWTWHECVAALEPLGLKHNPKCQCGGYQACKQANLSASDIAWNAFAAREKMAITSPPVSRQSAFDYKHHVDDCACGTCHKARVDSGTQDAYEKRCKEAAERVLERMAPTTVSCGSAFKAALDKAAEAISVASAKAGGADKPDFAKNLFAAMGTPHD